MKFPSYGERHKEAKKQKLTETDHRCEVSGVKKGTGELHNHHTQPKALGFFDQGDMASNGMILLEQYHTELHKVCKMDGEKVGKRQNYAKRVWEKPDDEKSLKKLRALDNDLIPEFIDGLLNKLQYHIRDKIVNVTLINAFKTNRDLKIQNHAQERKIEQLERQIDKLKRCENRKIIEITDFRPSHPQIHE